MGFKARLGGFIGQSIAASKSSAKGSWSLSDVLLGRKTSTWPVFTIAAPSTTETLVATAGTRYNTASQTISLVAGYFATIQVTLVGDGTDNGSACCGNCGRSASGEKVVARIVLDGTATSLVYTPFTGTPNNVGYAELKIVGGTMDGYYIRAGAGGAACGYANAAPPQSQASFRSGSWSLQAYGAYSYGSGNYYSDNYYYAPCGSSYGDGSNGYGGYGASGACSVGTAGAVWLQYLNDY